MLELKPRGPSGSGQDPDGIRVIAGDARGRRTTLLYLSLGILFAAGCAGYVLMPRSVPPSTHGEPEADGGRVSGTDDAAQASGVAKAAALAPTPAVAGAAAPVASTRSLTPRRMATQRPKGGADTKDDDERGPDEVPKDLPKDVTMGEYIQALHDAGIHEGIGAFNPPGTKPNLEGITVPPDFELPEGYVRHFQSTDDGQPIDPILMYSPDFEFFDANGNRIPIPEDRVVPPELAPPGMPIHKVEFPKPREPGDYRR